jgi:hypothetical protein
MVKFNQTFYWIKISNYKGQIEKKKLFGLFEVVWPSKIEN